MYEGKIEREKERERVCVHIYVYISFLLDKLEVPRVVHVFFPKTVVW